VQGLGQIMYQDEKFIQQQNFVEEEFSTYPPSSGVAR